MKGIEHDEALKVEDKMPKEEKDKRIKDKAEKI